MSTWDILITSIPHRHEKLLRLLECLDGQVPRFPGVGVILYRDDLEMAYGDKTQLLVDASSAEYVSCIDDDDLVAPDFVEAVMAAIESDPDYVGFQVLWTRDGIGQRPVIHSLAYNGWVDNADLLIRDITQFNPIRRTVARCSQWKGGYEAERRWADSIRSACGLALSEVFIDKRLYYYQESSGDTFTTNRQSLGVMPELPGYPWLRQIGPYA